MTQFGNYRPCVGIMLINRDGLVFVGRRRGKKSADPSRVAHEWQMPQGGIDPGEDPFQAALRELREETNVLSVSLLAEAPEWHSYDLPEEFSRKSWERTLPRPAAEMVRSALRRRRGRNQYLRRPPAARSRSLTHGAGVSIDDLVDLIIPFKRPVYEKVVETFAHLAAPAQASAAVQRG